MVAHGHSTFIESTSFNDSTLQLVVTLIWIFSPEGVQATSIIQVCCCVNFVALIIIPNFEDSSTLIVGYHYSKISLPFCKDCRIFCEGVKDDDDAFVKQGPANYDDDVNDDKDKDIGCGKNTSKQQSISLFHNELIKLLSNHIQAQLIVDSKISSLRCSSSLHGNTSLIGISGFGLVGLVGLSGINGLGFVGFIDLGLVSLVGLIGHISLVGLGGFSGISGLVGQISLVSLIGLIGLIGLISLGKLGITSLIGSLALSARRLIGLLSFTIRSLATIAAAAILSVAVASQAAEASILTRATKIANVAFYYFASSSLHVCLLVREKMCWWLALAKKKMWRWITSFGDSYHGDVLQFAKQLFSIRLPLMTKFFIMRECENILRGYLCAVTTVFSQQDGI
jgi:hypothetical protein